MKQSAILGAEAFTPFWSNIAQRAEQRSSRGFRRALIIPVDVLVWPLTLKKERGSSERPE